MNLAPRPKALGEYTKEELIALFEESSRQIERGEVYPAEEFFDELMKGL